MSRKRHTSKRPKSLEGSILVRTYGVTFSEGYESPAHHHQWDQFTYATQGVMTVKTEPALGLSRRTARCGFPPESSMSK